MSVIKKKGFFCLIGDTDGGFRDRVGEEGEREREREREREGEKERERERKREREGGVREREMRRV